MYWGTTYCTNDFMGSFSEPTLFGGSDPIKGQSNIGGSWAVRTLDYLDDAPCSQYVSTVHSDTSFLYYDSNT